MVEPSSDESGISLETSERQTWTVQILSAVFEPRYQYTPTGPSPIGSYVHCCFVYQGRKRLGFAHVGGFAARAGVIAAILSAYARTGEDVSLEVRLNWGSGTPFSPADKYLGEQIVLISMS